MNSDPRCPLATAALGGPGQRPGAAVRSVVRWGSRYGAASTALAVAARMGDGYAQLCRDHNLRQHPYEIYREIRDSAPVVKRHFIAVSARYDVVDEALHDPRLFSGFPEETLPGPVRRVLEWAQEPLFTLAADRPSMVMTNGAEHIRYRRLAAKAFTPRATASLANSIENICNERLDSLQTSQGSNGCVDVVREYAEAIPVQVMAEVLGVPREMRHEFVGWTQSIAALADVNTKYSVYRQAEIASYQLNQWFLKHFESIRTTPGTDLLSRFVGAAYDKTSEGPSITTSGLLANAALLLTAGNETSGNLIGSAIHALLSHPKQLDVVTQQPDLWGNCIDEVLRYESPLQQVPRYAREDMFFHGVRLRRGQFLICLIGAANRDPARFVAPEDFDVTRANARDHLAFSQGPHYCPGGELGRLVGRIAVGRFFDRFPDARILRAPNYRASFELHGLSQMMLDLGQRVSASI